MRFFAKAGRMGQRKFMRLFGSGSSAEMGNFLPLGGNQFFFDTPLRVRCKLAGFPDASCIRLLGRDIKSVRG